MAGHLGKDFSLYSYAHNGFLFMRIEAFFFKVERLGNAANHSPPFSNEMWKDRSLTLKSVYVFNKIQEIFNLI